MRAFACINVNVLTHYSLPRHAQLGIGVVYADRLNCCEIAQGSVYFQRGRQDTLRDRGWHGGRGTAAAVRGGQSVDAMRRVPFQCNYQQVLTLPRHALNINGKRTQLNEGLRLLLLRGETNRRTTR